MPQQRIRVLVVAEKPTVAKGIASILCPGARRSPTGAQYVSLYEFEHQIRGQVCDFAVTAVCGHLMGYDFHESFRKWHSCAPRALFDAPVVHVINDMNGNGVKIKVGCESAKDPPPPRSLGSSLVPGRLLVHAPCPSRSIPCTAKKSVLRDAVQT